MAVGWLQGGLKTAKVQILKNVTGALRPGTTTLLLGPPGSGKSVFMQSLSGRLQSDAKIKVQHAACSTLPLLCICMLRSTCYFC